MNEKERARKILDVLRENFTLPKWVSSNRTPFETLVITVISQNTSDRNTARAFENLSKKFMVTPENLLKVSVGEIEDALRVAGLYRNKARILKKLAEIVVEKFGGSLESIFRLPLEEARKILLALPGVGPKTADVLLLFCAKKPTFPIDTHINRVSKRLGFVDGKAGYEEIRQKLQNLFDAKDYFSAHILLILLGRRFCKARQPLCHECPINALCPMGEERLKNA